MAWRNLIQPSNEVIVLPWTGGKTVYAKNRRWVITRQPIEYGWWKFIIQENGRSLSPIELSNLDPNLLTIDNSIGYLIGDRFIPDYRAVVNIKRPQDIVEATEAVHLIPENQDKFTRVRVARTAEQGPLIFKNIEFPLGPESAVLDHFLEDKVSCDDIPGVVPALDAAFRMEVYQKAEAVRIRAELERLRLEEEAKRLAEEKRQELIAKIGSAETRRELAKIDFGEAAKAALAIGNAVYLDHRQVDRKNNTEMIVRFRFANRKFECICHAQTLRIIDSGICLQDHATGRRGDTWLSLEVLPNIINQAIKEHKLVVFRHA